MILSAVSHAIAGEALSSQILHQAAGMLHAEAHKDAQESCQAIT